MNRFGLGWGNPKLDPFVETPPPPELAWQLHGYGWWVLALCLAAVTARWARNSYLRYRANRYRRQALAWLDALPPYRVASPRPEYARVPALLRKVALCSDGRREVAPLSGRDWEAWLDSRCPGCDFAGRAHGLLYRLAYMPDPLSEIEMTQLLGQVRNWVRDHRRRDV
ncbi:DUF4381 domain-containing protein [Ferrimonas sediminicola]|uniref:DUF4381 domain-containing protein n=1 Tax=Ferrimonas sediminicola TaxID=2569538 RepID=UPI00145FD0C5|nr:DUF4381 domain-containing protein [Ferrimonas sediminicola]